ncbi:MAG: InlB B-repeat-containing protein [Firmicutes bacterium]|nr:InlB B-repeat-containing protein [Bacillota bacterium]
MSKKRSIYLSIIISIIVLFSCFALGVLTVANSNNIASHNPNTADEYSFMQMPNTAFAEYPPSKISITVGDSFVLRVVLNQGNDPNSPTQDLYTRFKIGWYKNKGDTLDLNTAEKYRTQTEYFYVDSSNVGKQYYFAVYINWMLNDGTPFYYEVWDLIEVSVEPRKPDTVLLNLNGGSGGTTSVVATYGENMPQATAPSRDGYIFSGYVSSYYKDRYYYDKNMNSVRVWDRIDNSPTDYKLVAQWEMIPIFIVTITLDYNGGNGGTSQVRATYGESMPQAIAPARDGYVFNGYTDKVDGGKRYYDGNMNSMTQWDKKEDDTLYAQWEIAQPEEYTITLDFNDGSSRTEQVVAIYGDSMPPATAPSRDGYIFNGYADSVDGGTLYYDEDMYSLRLWNKKEDTTLYAQWQENGGTQQEKYTVTLDFNGGNGGTNQVVAVFGESMPPATAPSRDGYIFNGYADSVDGGKFYYGAKMNSVSVWDKKEDTTLYAQWKEDDGTSQQDKYTITLDFNGGSNGTEQVVAIYGGSMPQATAPSRDGYIFIGYTDGLNGGKIYYGDDMTPAVSVWDKEEDYILYAQWETKDTELPLTPSPTNPTTPTNSFSGDFGELLGWSVGGAFVLAVVLSGIIIMLKRKKNVRVAQYGYRRSSNRNDSYNNNQYNSYYSQYNNTYNNDPYANYRNNQSQNNNRNNNNNSWY